MGKVLSRGLLVAFEGLDGSGKSTQARRLADALLERGYGVVPTREPTDGPWGQRIRQSRTTGRLAPREEFEVFLEDRRLHVDEVIEPALRSGQVVVVDRYYLSSIAYQGARGLDPVAIRAANEAVVPRPDLVFLFDVPVEVGLRRIVDRGGEPDSFERASDLTRFAAIFAGLPDHTIERVDGTRSADEIADAVLKRTLRLISTLDASGAPPG